MKIKKLLSEIIDTPSPYHSPRTKSLRHLLAVVLMVSALPALAAGTPPADHNLRLAAPISSWDDALPLGNGLMGGLLWGERSTLRLSLDRGDLWDERTHGEANWWAKNTWENAVKGGDPWASYYNGVTPTKLPAGRLQITLPPGKSLGEFELNLATAEGVARFKDDTELRAFYSATMPVALIRIPGRPTALDILPAGAGAAGNAGPSSGGAVSALGYPAALRGSTDNTKWFIQDGVDGFQYCVFIETREAGAETLLALAITCTTDLKSEPSFADCLSLARSRCAKAIAVGYDTMLQSHAAWWSEFWSQSSVNIPELPLQKYYQFARYLYGAGSRQGAPPIPLQGVWTADNGGLPPWKGDYHNDLNTQMTYIAYQGAGNFEAGRSYLDYLTRLTPVFQDFARDFYKTRGLSTPGVMSLGGQPLGGWGQYSLSPTMTAWNAHLFYLHWRYTADDKFLQQQAWPWCEQTGQCLAALLKPDASGRLVLPFSSSPEIHDNTTQAWLVPNSNYDLMSMKMLFLALVEMATAQGKSADAAKWADLAAKLGDYHAKPDGELMLDARESLNESHRHFSNLMAIFPFNLITIDGSETERQRIRASVATWDKFGPSQWCGYSWAWMSCLRARIGEPEAALRNFDVFAKAFVSRNGFHLNGDQTGSGYSSYTYRPFTLEGNFIAMQAVHEMLLQSWSPTPGQSDTEVIRLFPATAWRWHDASFTDLRAEGGHRVSARRQNNATTSFRIRAGKTGTLRIRDNFGGRTPKWNVTGVTKNGSDFIIAAKNDQVIEATLAIPDAPPAAPADLAEPVVIPVIKANSLPLRIGADSNGDNRFHGDIAQVTVSGRTYSDEEIQKLGDPKTAPDTINTASVENKLVLPSVADLSGKAFRMIGAGFIEIPHQPQLDPSPGVTLAAWIRAAELPAGGMRIIDKCPVGSSQGYMLDTFPNGSLRLISRYPVFAFPANLTIDKWTHVAATVDSDGRQKLYINGQQVAASP